MAPNRSLNSNTSPSASAAAAVVVDSENERDIWSSILQQVQKTATNKLPSNKSILVLGDNDSGKTSLIAKMQGSDATCKGSGLEYHYLMVRDEYRDEQTQCGVWILDGNYEWKQNLLKFALNENNFADTTILLVCSMNKPWEIFNSLQNWGTILENHIKSLKIDHKVLDDYRDQNRRRFQDYISPGDEIEGLSIRNRCHSYTNADGESERDPLPDNVLTKNLGLDIVVAVTKTDFMSVLEKEYDYKEEHFDFIQQAVRKFCLKYGASLVYLSAKINKNCDLLYKYLVHRIYGLKFKTPALVVEKDALFIPSGWDNEKKIAILYENIQSFSPDDDYNEIITFNSISNPTTKEQEIVAEDDQIFLIKLRTQLIQQAPSNSSTSLRTTNTSATGTTPVSKTDRRTPGLSGTPGAMLDNSKNSPGGEGVLQTFFNSLLNRKSVGGGGGGGGVPSGASTPVLSNTSGVAAGGGGSPAQSRTPLSSTGGGTSSESLRNRNVQAELDRIIDGSSSNNNNINDS